MRGDRMTTGERIKETRKYRKMTQKQLAEAAGVATGTIQQYELGKREPRYEILIRICKALNISILVFLLPGSTPIKYLTPEAVDDEINKRNHFGAYIKSLGYELFAETDGSLGDVFSQKSSGGADGHTLIVDYNHKRLFLLDDAVYRDVLEEDIAAYARFRLQEMMNKATEVFDDGNGGWFETDPRDEQIEKYLLEKGLKEDK